MPVGAGVLAIAGDEVSLGGGQSESGMLERRMLQLSGNEHKRCRVFAVQRCGGHDDRR